MTSLNHQPTHKPPPSPAPLHQLHLSASSSSSVAPHPSCTLVRYPSVCFASAPAADVTWIACLCWPTPQVHATSMPVNPCYACHRLFTSWPSPISIGPLSPLCFPCYLSSHLRLTPPFAGFPRRLCMLCISVPSNRLQLESAHYLPPMVYKLLCFLSLATGTQANSLGLPCP